MVETNKGWCYYIYHVDLATVKMFENSIIMRQFILILTFMPCDMQAPAVENLLKCGICQVQW